MSEKQIVEDRNTPFQKDIVEGRYTPDDVEIEQIQRKKEYWPYGIAVLVFVFSLMIGLMFGSFYALPDPLGLSYEIPQSIQKLILIVSFLAGIFAYSLTYYKLEQSEKLMVAKRMGGHEGIEKLISKIKERGLNGKTKHLLKYLEDLKDAPTK